MDESKTRSRQVDLGFFVEIRDPLRQYRAEELFEYLAEHQESTRALYEALLSGKDFPELPDDFAIRSFMLDTMLTGTIGG